MEVGFVVGGWLASTVISKLINYAKDQKMQLGLKDELVARLENGLPNIQEVVKTVDQGLIREENPALEKWLWQLRDAADQADDVMDEIKYNYEKEKVEAEKNKFNKRLYVEAEENKVNKRLKVEEITNNFRIFCLGAVDEDPFLKSLKKAVKAIDEVAEDVGLFSMLVQNLVSHQKKKVKLVINSRETTSFFNFRNHVFGRQEEKEDIIKKLLNPNCNIEENNFVVLPIIGVGGVGKTTLAQLVYNDPIVEKNFELRLWVCISNNFDLFLLTKKLYESAFGQRANNFDSFDLTQNKLTEKLESKRFLVVFDDAWNDNNKEDWEKLIAPLKNGKEGSMMLLTARMKSVTTLIGPNLLDSINLEGLSECDMWDLFKECAFAGEDPDYHKELVEIGRDIVKKLEGIPLAAKTVGGILCSNLDEDHWTSVLDSDLWSLKQGNNDIMPALRLTYQYLSPHMRQCFSFCSIFPQDHLFNKNDLINMWIALGMVPQSVNGTMKPEDVGSKCFDDMVSKSIFSPRPNMYTNYKNEFVMHDLIHDLSTLVSQGECLRTSTNKLVYVPNTVRHLCAHIDGPCELSISGLKNLRSLVLDIDESYHPEQDSLVTEMLKGMESLRLLVLFAHNLSEFADISAEKLLHLRYLSLNSTRMSALPKFISRLYLLETMVYKDSGSSQIKQADALGMLFNLRHLIAPRWLSTRIASIGRLTSLQELSFSVGKDNGFKICELSGMRELRELYISGIQEVGSREEVIQANLKDKVNLHTLSLTWGRRSPNKQANGGFLDHLQPHTSLKELVVLFYECTGRPPIWFRAQALTNLVRLKLQCCNFTHLPCLEELRLLKYIDFRDMNALESIIHECNLSSTGDAFPSLEWLYICRMRAIKKWCLVKQPNKWMHCLRKLDVFNCPELQALPPIPIGVKEVTLKVLGLNALPNIWNDQSSKSRSIPALAIMSIIECENFVSLSEGLFQNPERFVDLEELEIYNCAKLMHLPPGGFNKFISLKSLKIVGCPNIMVKEECFLPSALQKLSISRCGHFETNLSKALKGIHSLIGLELRGCLEFTGLPSKEVFSRWKILQRLTLEDCIVLTSLESLVGLSCIEFLEVRGRNQLSRAIPDPLLLNKDETERKEEDRSISARPQPLFSVDELVIDNPFLLSVDPLRSLSTVKELTIEDCSELQSLPDLPPFLQRLSIQRGSPELWTRCQKSDQDWPKLAQIPKVYFNSSLLSMNDFVEEDNAGYLLD